MIEAQMQDPMLINTALIPSVEIKNLASTFLAVVKAFYDDPRNEQEFQEWKQRREETCRRYVYAGDKRAVPLWMSHAAGMMKTWRILQPFRHRLLVPYQSPPCMYFSCISIPWMTPSTRSLSA